MKIGFIGLGNMGLSLSLNLKDHGHEVIGWNRSEERREVARTNGLEVRASIAETYAALSDQSPKVLFLLVAADAVEEVLFGPGGVFELVNQGDIVIDGANSHFRNSQERAKRFAEKGVKYLDCGISGGIEGARNGTCLMLGGEIEAVHQVQQLFMDISVPGGYAYMGTSGAGHYTKMVHNAIEYGMMQAIAEGLNLLSMSEFKPNLEQVTNLWGNGSIIQGKLIQFLHQALTEDVSLGKVSAEIGSLGTAKWAVEEALDRQAPFNSIANAVFTRFESNGFDRFEHKIIQAMREVFGGHNSQN